MKFSYVILILSVLQNGLIIEILGYTWSMPVSLISEKGNCSKLISFQQPRLVSYIETYKEKTWGFYYKTKTRRNYRTEYYTAYHVAHLCCNGYEIKILGGRCEPICKPNCGKGMCVEPNICLCYTGYTFRKNIIDDSACVPECDNPCVHGKCTAPNICTCDNGYSLSADRYTCEPICNPSCRNNSYCSKPDRCSCLQGYNEISQSNAKEKVICEPICDKKCIHGTCTAPNTCTCDNGYELDPFNLFVCKPKCEHGCLYGTCTAPNVCTCDNGYSLKSSSECEPICSEACVKGICVAPESCSCFEGYALLENSKYICEPVCERACLNGRCTEPGVCTCDEGFRLSGDESAKHICIPHCETSCEPFGTCTAPNVCTCFEGYHLADKTQANQNSTRYFADSSVCKPICEIACVNAFCSAPNTCTCNIGYHLSDSNPAVCEPICGQSCVNSFCGAPETCTCNEGYKPSTFWNICDPFCETDCVNGHCSAPNECTCNPGYRPIDGNYTNICEPICNPSCKNGICVQPDVCNCNLGYRQPTHSTNVCDPVCHSACETNGICEAPDLCVCKNGYRMVYYDEGNVPFQCEPICSVVCGNGTCTAPDICTCSDGYRNAKTGTCEPICSTCDNGTCVAPEVCECNDGFILEDSNVNAWNYPSTSGNISQNGSRCIPHCESCDNGECVAPNECQCNAGFVQIEGVCVHACRGGCGNHGECIDELMNCECNYGWSGLHCDRPTLCILTLSDDGNRTEPLTIIEEQNATIEYVLINNPTCSECINEINNRTACFKIYINSTEGETQIGCLMNRVECLALRSDYKSKWKKVLKISGITGSVILLSICAAIATYMTLRKHQNKQMNLGNVQGEHRHSASMQGLIQQSDNNS